MGVTLKNAYTGQPGLAAGTVYTCPANTQGRILKATATNDTSTATTITAYLVPPGGAAGAANMVINAKAIGPNEDVDLDALIGQVLDTGDFISMLAGVADQVTVAISVAEIV